MSLGFNTFNSGVRKSSQLNAGKSFSFLSSLPTEFSYEGNGGVGTYRDNTGTLNLSTSNQPRFDHDASGNALGILIEPSRTNKTTGKNYNPVSGDETAAFDIVSGTGSITVVDKASELAAAGLDGICSNGNVYFIQSTSSYRIRLAGPMGNTNPHSFGAYVAYGDTFYIGTFKISGSADQILMQDSSVNFGDFRWIEFENDSPTTTSRQLEFNLQSGRSLYIILFDAQEGSNMTSVIANTGGGTKTRAVDELYDLSYSTRDYYSGTEGSVIAQFRFGSDTVTTGAYPFIIGDSTGLSSNNLILNEVSSRSKLQARVYANSTSEISGDVHGWKANRPWPLAATWKNGGNASVLAGPVAYKQEALGNDFTGLDRIYLGGRSNGTSPFFGHISSVKFYKTERTIPQIGQDMILSGYRVIVGGGQSNMTGYFSQQNDSTNGGEKRMLQEYDSYRTSTTNFVANGSSAGSQLIYKSGDNWWYNTSTLTYGPAWDRWENVARGCANATIEAIIWDQGESDVGETKTDYKAALLTVLTRMRAIVGSVPVIIIPIGARTDAEQNGYQTIREAQQELATETSWIHLAPEKFDNELETSGPHLTDDGYIANAPRVIRKVMDVVGETVSGGVDGPEITNALRSGTTVTVTITHDGGTDFTPTTSIDGFVFLDDSTEINITNAVRTNATTITLTLASTPTGTETLYYGYRALFGITLTNLVKDNDSAGTLPLRSAKIVL